MENLFESMSHPDSIMFLISVLFCFLLGFLTGWAMWGNRAKRYRKEAAQWKKSYDELSIELKTLREQLDLKEADLVKAQREAEEAHDQLTAFYHDKAKWQSDLDAAVGETVKLQATISSYQSTIEDLNNQVLGLKARNAQLTKDAEREGTALDQVAQMRSSFNTTLNRVGSLEEKITLLIAENQSLRTTSNKEDQQLAHSHADSAKRISALEAKMNALVEENDSLHAELASLKSGAHLALGATAADMEPALEIHQDKSVMEKVILSGDAREAVLAAIGSKIPAANADEKDDLTKIKGIGSFIENKLNHIGIYTYHQISQFDGDIIENVTDAIEFFPGRIKRDNWVGQAADLMNGVQAAAEDDLKLVEGIGPKIEKLLNGKGIKTFEALASTTADHLREILNKAGERYRIHDPATWPDQARLAADGEWEKLKEYQDFLLGGRDPGQGA